MTPEGRLLKRVSEFARREGLTTLRLSFARGVVNGWPDLLLLIPGGRPIFLELKAPGKTPTPLQILRISNLMEWGYDVFFTDSFNEARTLITSAMGAAALHDARRGAPGKKSRGRACT